MLFTRRGKATSVTIDVWSLDISLRDPGEIDLPTNPAGKVGQKTIFHAGSVVLFYSLPDGRWPALER